MKSETYSPIINPRLHVTGINLCKPTTADRSAPVLCWVLPLTWSSLILHEVLKVGSAVFS